MSYILYGPQGSGKTTIAERLRARLKAKRVIEEDSPDAPRGGVWKTFSDGRLPALKAMNVLFVTSEPPPPFINNSRRVIHIDDAKSMLGVA